MKLLLPLMVVPFLLAGSLMAQMIDRPSGTPKRIEVVPPEAKESETPLAEEYFVLGYSLEAEALGMRLGSTSLASLSLMFETAPDALYMNPSLPEAYFSNTGGIAHGSTGKFPRLTWDERPVQEASDSH